jgi:hypothetical protein
LIGRAGRHPKTLPPCEPVATAERFRRRLSNVERVPTEAGAGRAPGQQERNRTMKDYPKNSPEAVARVVAMMMITDSSLDDRELGIMDELRIYDIIGISRGGFSQVVQDYCTELMGAGGKNGHIRLVDKDRIDRIVDLVDDKKMRVQTCGMLLNIAKADGKLHDTELAVFKYILERWGMTLESLETDLAKA